MFLFNGEDGATHSAFTQWTDTPVQIGGCDTPDANGCCYREVNQDTVYPPPDNLVSAGVVHVSDAQGSIDLVPDSGTYPMSSGLAWSDGDALVFRGDGDVASAFSMRTHAPAELTQTLPSISLDSTLSVDRNQPQTITWTASGQADAVVDISMCGPSARTGFQACTECIVPDAAGSCTLPSSMLMNAQPGAGVVSVSRLALDSLPSGNALITTLVQEGSRAGNLLFQ